MVSRGSSGTSPEEGSAKASEIGAFSFRRTCSESNAVDCAIDLKLFGERKQVRTSLSSTADRIVSSRGTSVRVGRVRLLVGARRAAEDLRDHPEIAVGGEVRDPDPAEFAAENDTTGAAGPSNGS
jgi:Tfp pilus assembly pilus retraction ATPase PilT